MFSLTSDPAGCVILPNPRWKLCKIHRSGKRAKHTHLGHRPSWNLSWPEGNQITRQAESRGKLEYVVIIFHCHPWNNNFKEAVSMNTKSVSISLFRTDGGIFWHISHCGLWSWKCDLISKCQVHNFGWNSDICFTGRNVLILIYLVFFFWASVLFKNFLIFFCLFCLSTLRHMISHGLVVCRCHLREK